MSHGRITTRFAPSPTGELHLGNARTALFSWLFARHHGGRFVLRIEDTDTERSKEAYTAALMDDLRWMGLHGMRAPAVRSRGEEYHQSRRGAIYARHSATLDARGLTYPCYCTPLELDLSRKAQLAAGRPPRYAGTCRELSPEARVRKSAQGISPTTRFRVPTGQRVEFDDMVHGAQSFATDDIGDFILRRADGSAAFFFSNAIDDAEMGITHVLRGEDHLTNTPRQLLVLEALEPARADLRAPVAAGGRRRLAAVQAPRRHQRARVPRARLSTRGARQSPVPARAFEQRERRAARSTPWRAHFTVKHLGRAPARFEESQLNVWQREVAHHMPLEESERWLAAETPRDIDAAAPPRVHRRDPAQCAAARGRRALARSGVRRRRPRSMRPRWRACARRGRSSSARRPMPRPRGGKLDAIVDAVKAATGAKGQALWKPLRLALTGCARRPRARAAAQGHAGLQPSIDRLSRFAA